MDKLKAELFQAQSPTPTLVEGVIAGVAIPFNVSSREPGIHFDEETGKLTFFSYTLYTSGSLNSQLSSAQGLDRTRLMWEHGLQGGVTTIPIGNVRTLVASEDAVRFTAILNETSVANEMRLALSQASVKEVSVKIESLKFDFPTDSEGLTFRRVTDAFIWDVSLVRNGQFPQARLTEVFCGGCGQSRPVHDEQPPHAGSVTGNANGYARVTQEQLGELYARINDLQEERTLHSCQETLAKREGG